MSADDNIRIVLDTGSQYTKAGFAGEAFPRCVYPTTVGRFRRWGLIDGLSLIYCGKEAIKQRGLSRLTWPVIEGLIQDWDEMEKFWHHTFYTELHIPPEHSQILHAIHPLTPGKDKEKMTEILFESFAFNGVYLAISSALALHATGKTTGIVWENGFSCSYVAPVFEGYPLKNATVSTPITGDTLTNYLHKLLTETGYSLTTPAERDILNNIKAEKCYVSTDYDEEIKTGTCSGESKVKFRCPDGQFICLGEERIKCPELIFQPSLSGHSCPNIIDNICSTIDMCDLDYKLHFYDNIYISGGSTMFPGLVERMNLELTRKMLSVSTGIKTKVDGIPCRQFAVWAGGSILASMTCLKGFWMTKQEYEDVGSDRVRYKFF